MVHILKYFNVRFAKAFSILQNLEAGCSMRQVLRVGQFAPWFAKVVACPRQLCSHLQTFGPNL